MRKFKYSPAPRWGTCGPNLGPTHPEPLHFRSQRSKHRWSSNLLRAPTIVYGERWDSFLRRGRSAQKNAWFWLSLWDRPTSHSCFEFTSAEASGIHFEFTSAEASGNLGFPRGNPRGKYRLHGSWRSGSAQKNAWFWLSLWDRPTSHSCFEFTSAEASGNLGFPRGT